VKKNKPNGKKKKCVLKCDPGFKIKWTKMNKDSFKINNLLNCFNVVYKTWSVVTVTVISYLFDKKEILKPPKYSKKAKDGRIKCLAGEGWIAKPDSLTCIRK